MNPRVRLTAATVASAVAIAIGVGAAWPIYSTALLWVPAAAGLGLGVLVAAASARLRWGSLVTAAALAFVFVLTVVPVAVPSALRQLPDGLMQGLTGGLASTVLGWKQLLTLTLPVGSFQSTLVPAYLVFLATSFTVTLIALRSPRFSPFAATMLALPVAFGTVFGASQISASLQLGPFMLRAPREVLLWTLTVALAALWVWWASGTERRAALRKGRSQGESVLSSGPVLRVVAASATVVISLVAGVLVMPVLDASAREVLRDRVDPEVVVREQTSPLAAYRVWKSDAAIDSSIFEIDADGPLPERLRLAVLDGYDGVDFHVSSESAGAFTRFPSGAPVPDPVSVTVQIGEGYSDIWVPTGRLGSAPVFMGPRAISLADSFYVNRDTGAAIAVPGEGATQGLRDGDGYRVEMSAALQSELTGGPLSDSPRVDLESVPELAAWVEAQEQPATAAGLLELIDRLRNRGYLSHGISDGTSSGSGGSASSGSGSVGSESLWLQRLADRYGTVFESSPGGHSLARIEQLFAQLNAQQRLAGEDVGNESLVAAVGDDEQFAAASALIARSLGYDSRVVLGVRIGDDPESGTAGVPACTSVCTGEHLAAWIEVRGDAFEWIAIDVTPQAIVRPITLEEGEQLPEFPTVPEERDAREVDPPLGIGERSDESQPIEQPAEAAAVWPFLRIGLLSLGALALTLLPFLFVPLAKRARARSRRRQRDPEIRALGAWNEMVDRARDAGIEIAARASRAEIAESLNTAPARWAAREVDRAVFSPSGISDADADWVWAAAEADRAERESNFGGWQRVRVAYGLRSYREDQSSPRSSQRSSQRNSQRRSANVSPQ